MTKNVTLSLPEHVALWARLKAAQADTSVSSFLAGILQQQMRDEETFDAAYQQWRVTEPIAEVDAAKRMSRDEVHERRA